MEAQWRYALKQIVSNCTYNFFCIVYILIIIIVNMFFAFPEFKTWSEPLI